MGTLPKKKTTAESFPHNTGVFYSKAAMSCPTSQGQLGDKGPAAYSSPAVSSYVSQKGGIKKLQSNFDRWA